VKALEKVKEERTPKELTENVEKVFETAKKMLTDQKSVSAHCLAFSGETIFYIHLPVEKEKLRILFKAINCEWYVAVHETWGVSMIDYNPNIAIRDTPLRIEALMVMGVMRSGTLLGINQQFMNENGEVKFVGEPQRTTEAVVYKLPIEW
jgi:hypothetical protein